MSLEMKSICLILFLVCLSGLKAFGAPTKEANLDSELSVKSDPTKADVDQFHKDQPHLIPGTPDLKEDGKSSNTIGWPDLSRLPGLTQISGQLDPGSYVSQLNLPDPSLEGIAQWIFLG